MVKSPPVTPDATSGDGDPRVLPDDASMGATEDQYPLPDEQGSGGPGSNNEHGNPDLLSDRDDMDDMEETCLTSLSSDTRRLLNNAWRLEVDEEVVREA